jgi:hypothetical protein
MWMINPDKVMVFLDAGFKRIASLSSINLLTHAGDAADSLCCQRSYGGSLIGYCEGPQTF